MYKKVLVVDDEMVMRSLVTIAIQRNGFVVADADNSAQALSYLDKTTPDVIVLDIMMPGMNGIDLCRRIRKRPDTKNTPIIVFSALGDDSTIASAYAAGANRYVHKLNRFGDLINQIQDTLASANLTH